MATPESKFILTAENRASPVLSKVSGDFGKLSSAARAASGMLAMFGGALSVGVIAGWVREVASLQDSIGKLAQQTGVGVRALSELDYAAKLSDVSTEELGTGLVRLTSRMADVMQGSKSAASAFNALGVQVKNQDGTMRGADDVLTDVAQRFSEFEDGSTKTALAVELFGRSGAKLIPLLNQGRAGLAAMGAEARALGVSFDEGAAKAAEEFNDNLTRLGQSWAGLKMTFFGPLVQALVDVTSQFMKARAAGLGFLDALGVDKSNIGSQIEFFEKKLSGLQKQLAAGGRDFYGRPVETSLLDAQVKETEAKLIQLRNLQLALQGIGEPPTVGASIAPPKFAPPSDRSGKTGTKDAVDSIKSLIDSSLARDFERLQQDVEALDSVIGTAIDRDATRLKAAADRWKDLIDPSRAYMRQLEEIRDLVASGALSPAQGIAAEFEVENRRQDELFGDMTENIAEATQAAERFGFTFASAFEDAVLSGKKLKDVLSGLGQDFARMFLRKSVTEPLANAMSASFAGLFPKHADGLDYVPYDGYIAELHRGERVQTAAEAKADRGAMNFAPQITVNGEMSRSQEARLVTMMRNVALATMADQRRRGAA